MAGAATPRAAGRARRLAARRPPGAGGARRRAPRPRHLGGRRRRRRGRGGAVLVLRPRHARQLPRRLRPREALGQGPRLGARRRPRDRRGHRRRRRPPISPSAATLPSSSSACAVVVAALAAPGLALGLGERHREHRRRIAAQSRSVVVTKTEKELRPALPGKAMNILLIGSDKTKIPGDTGRSDTQILVRLDPDDQEHLHALGAARPARADPRPRLRQDEHGLRLRRAAARRQDVQPSSPACRINHFVEVDFAGFWHVVNILGGVVHPRRPPVLRPGERRLQVHRHLAGLPAHPRSRRARLRALPPRPARATSRACSASSSSSRRCSASRTAGAGTGPRSSASSRPSPKRRPPTSTRSSACSRSSSSIFQVNTSKVYTVHLEGAGADDRRRLLRDPHPGRDRPGRRRVHAAHRRRPSRSRGSS